MRRLLRSMGAGAPLDTLLARIRGRRAFLVSDWEALLLTADPLAALPPAPWRRELAAAGGQVLAQRAFSRESARLFGWLEEPLRRKLAPLFWLAEIPALAGRLRLISGRRKPAGDEEETLLAKPLQRALGLESATAAVAGVTACLAPLDHGFAALPEIYRRSGPGGVEAALHDLTLEYCTGQVRQPQLKRYVTLLIDSRNLLAIAKHQRWRLAVQPKFLRGGSLRPPDLAALFAADNQAALLQRIARLGGADTVVADTPEKGVLQAQLTVMQRLAREPGGIGLVLDYLWRCGMEARNIALLAGLARAGDEAVAREIGR